MEKFYFDDVDMKMEGHYCVQHGYNVYVMAVLFPWHNKATQIAKKLRYKLVFKE
ncbi:MAG: hypothetical protein K6C34_00225 [Alphaproteobacteria bacterium]|nr:hypothetical protein [Alphaproteobacteria bacterium]